MSVSTAESELRRARSALEDARRKQAAEEKKAAAADKAAAEKVKSAQRTSSPSLAQSYLRTAETKSREAQKSRAKAAEHSGKAATAQQRVHAAEQKLVSAQTAEDKKRRDAERRAAAKREADEKRQRREAESASRRAAQEQQRLDAARDQQIADLEAQLADAQATLDGRPWDDAPGKITVLFITAEPDGLERLHIDRELRQIQEQVRSSELRDSIAFEMRPAARVTDLLQHLNEVEPDVVHFSGHGAQAGIALHDADDKVRLLSNEDLVKVLAAAPNPLRLAVFNSCDSVEQAHVAAEHVDAAIGMQQSIADESARVFAGQLYNSLGFGRSLGLAFTQARLQVELTFGTVSGNPSLVVAPGLDADELVIVAPSSSSDAGGPGS